MQELIYQQILHDIIVGTTCIIIVLLIIMIHGLLRRSRGQNLGNIGLSIYLSTFLVYTLLTNLVCLYGGSSDNSPVAYYGLIQLAGTIWSIGMIIMMYMIEHDLIIMTRRRMIVTPLAIIYSLIFLLLIDVTGIPATQSLWDLPFHSHILHGYTCKDYSILRPLKSPFRSGHFS